MTYTSKTYVKPLLWVVLLFLFLLLLLSPSVVKDGVTAGFSSCVTTLIPALFPFLVLTNLICATGLADALGRVLAFPCRVLFGLSPSCGAAVVLGALSGFPVGAYTAVSLCERGRCSPGEAGRMLAFCTNAGPAFLIGGVGVYLWGDARIGLLLWLSQLAAACVVGVSFRLPRDTESIAVAPQEPLSLSALCNAIPQAAQQMLAICGTAVFFEVVLTALFAGELFAALPVLRTLAAGFLEVTSGITAATAAFGTRLPVLGITLCGMFVGWSGLSVCLQVAAAAKSCKLRLGFYLRGKILQGLLTGGFALVGATIFFS